MKLTTKTKQPGRVKSTITGALLGWLGVPIGLSSTFWGAWRNDRDRSGRVVTVNSALQLSTAMACVRLVSQTVSTLPITVFKQQGDEAVPARDSQIFYLLKRKPNAQMTASVFWQTFVASLMLWGNAYVEKRYSGATLTSLDFLRPEYMTARLRRDGSIEWNYADPLTGQTREIPENLMWHTPAFTLDGFLGVSPITLGANIFGTSLAAEEASSDTFSKGMKSTGLVMMDEVLKGDQRNLIREHVKKVTQEGGVMVLEKGAGFQQMNMNPQDAELLSTRSFQVEEIARWFGVDPSLIGHGGKDSNWGSGLQEKRDWLVTLLLRPLCKRIEDSIWNSLFSPAERLTHYAEWGLEGLLRGDTAARAAFYSTMTKGGIMTLDECRKLENLPLMGGNAGKLMVQLNMSPIDKLGEAPAEAVAQDALKTWLGIEEKDRTDEQN